MSPRFNDFINSMLGLSRGIDTQLSRVTASGNNTTKSIERWLRDGSQEEDHPIGRAANHFHNPLLSWDQSYCTDSWIMDIWTRIADWRPLYSNITWATGYKTPTEKANMDSAYNPYVDPPVPNNWDNARLYYYRALTRITPTGVYGRDTALAQTFQALGQVMHLLQDMAVPAHVRNDFQSHLTWGYSPGYWPYNPFEYYLKSHTDVVKEAIVSSPTVTMQRLTDFWDTGRYKDSYDRQETNPGLTVQSAGLAEYTNANFVSDYTFTFGTSDGSGQTTMVSGSHQFPYPKATSADRFDKTINIHLSSGTVTAVRPYYKKVRDGDTGYLLAGVSYLQFAVETKLTVNKEQTISHLEIVPPMDNVVHEDYAKKILPRAVGYSAALLNYFFRGTIAIGLPSSGIYSSATSTEPGFSRITLVAKNTTTGEEMSDGTIQLVVKYKLAKADPFGDLPVETDEEFSYKVVSEANNIRSLPTGASVNLTFNLSSDPIPFWATDVYLQLVYHGKLGNEDGAVAVGFKDISEPTPVDFFNNMDKICLNGEWYNAGPEVSGLVPAGWDIYSHSVGDGYLKIAPKGDTAYASPSDYTFPEGTVLPGALYRAYILGDYDYQFNYSNYTPVTETTTADKADHTNAILKGRITGSAVKNQVDYHVTDQGACDEIGETAPCDILTYPLLYSFRGKKIWGPVGFIVDNPKYPTDTTCSWEALN